MRLATDYEISGLVAPKYVVLVPNYRMRAPRAPVKDAVSGVWGTGSGVENPRPAAWDMGS